MSGYSANVGSLRKNLALLIGLLLVGVSAVVGSASAADTPPPGNTTIYMLLLNGYRNFTVHIPPHLKKDAPLLVVLHPATGTSKYARENYHFDEIADQYGFVSVYPAGTALSWNAGQCCGLSYSLHVNDVSFLDSMVGELIKRNMVSTRSKVYATGLSNGASMAYHWACEGTTFVTGIAPVGGSMQAASCTNPRTPMVIQIQGSRDQNYPEDGDPAKRTNHLTIGNTTQSLNKSISPFLKSHGCDVSNAPKGVPDYNLPYPTDHQRVDTDTDTITRYWWRGCSPGTRFEKFITTAQHGWPCAEQPKRSSIYDVPGVEMSASLTMLNELGIAKVGTLGHPIDCIYL